MERTTRQVHSNVNCELLCLDSLFMVFSDDLWLLIVSIPVHRSMSSPTEPFSAQARPKQALHVTSILRNFFKSVAIPPIRKSFRAL